MLRSRTALALALIGLVLTMTPAVASQVQTSEVRLGSQLQRGGASLSTSPANYVGGQAITFAGNIGTRGKRRVWLQLHMNRPGDKWFGVRGFNGAKTSKDGSFNFQFQAPSMFGIRYRVKARKRATPAVTFNAKGQDITAWVENTNRNLSHNHAVAGEPFTLAVDTTTTGSPAFPGRGLTLQRRLTGQSWEDLGRSVVGADGRGAFPGLTSPAGTVVYRVVADDILTGANRIGWIQTFPTYVTVLASAPATGSKSPSKNDRLAPRLSSAPTSSSARRGAGAASATASSRNRWYPILWDYTWESGQSLTSPADLGSDRDGWWLDYADGAGRVSKHNGGLYLDSQRNRSGPGDFGTTRATLMDSARAYGRWESRLRLISGESNAADFRALVELVPERASDYACGRRNITIAEVSAHGTSMSFGAKADTVQWSRSKKVPSLIHSSPAVAVEVSKRRITWFLNGKPVGHVKSKKAVSGVPMTLRFSLVGDHSREFDKTGLISDWQRGFDIRSGKLTTKGPKMKRSALTDCEA